MQLNYVDWEILKKTCTCVCLKQSLINEPGANPKPCYHVDFYNLVLFRFLHVLKKSDGINNRDLLKSKSSRATPTCSHHDFNMIDTVRLRKHAGEGAFFLCTLHIVLSVLLLSWL